MSSIKDRNGMDLTEAEDIKKRWQEYTEELYKKDLQRGEQSPLLPLETRPDSRVSLECNPEIPVAP